MKLSADCAKGAQVGVEEPAAAEEGAVGVLVRRPSDGAAQETHRRQARRGGGHGRLLGERADLRGEDAPLQGAQQPHREEPRQEGM